MLMLSDLDKVKNALLSVTSNVFHYEALGVSDKYIVWAEDSEASSVEADNIKVYQAIQGTIDYYTLEENDTNIEVLQNALNEAEISFYLNSIQYEDETRLIHYEWVFEV